MLEIYGNTSAGEDYNLLFTEFDKVIKEHIKVFDDEDVNGWSCRHLDVSLWYGAFLYAVLLKYSYLQGFYSLSNLLTKYKLSELKRCLECRKIPILYMLELLGVIADEGTTKGINSMTIESTFVTEEVKCNPPVDSNGDALEFTSEGISYFQSLWESESNCEILLKSNC